MLFRRLKNKDKKKKKNSSLPENSHSISPIESMSFGKVSVSASLQGSMTVECAFLLPLFLLGMVTLISYMELFSLQTERLLSLCERTKQAGMYAYLQEEGREEVVLSDVYSFEAPVQIIPLPKVWNHNIVTVHAWTGYVPDEGDGQTQNEEMVYVTPYGRVYHKSTGCRYLDLSVEKTDIGKVSELRNRYGEKYKACETCCSGKEKGTVYVTETGNRYHSLSRCSGLKRTVRLVKKSTVSDMRACSACGG